VYGQLGLFVKQSHNSLTTFQSAFVGSVAGLVASIVSCPVETLKVRANLGQYHVEDSGFVKATLRIMKERGITGLYTGFGISALRDSLGYGAFFGSFTMCHNFLRRHSLQFSGENTLHVLISGGFAGLVYQILSYPVESFREKQIEDGTTAIKTWYNCVQSKHGVRQLYNGFRQSARKAIPAASVAFVVFQLLNHYYKLSDDFIF